MNWIKQKMRGQVTVTTLAGVLGLIGMIGVAFTYFSNIEARSTEADAELNTAIVVNATNIINLEKKIDESNKKLDKITDYLNIK